MEKEKQYGQWIFGFFVTTLILIEIALSVDFSSSLLVILLQIDLFIVLIAWYLLLGIVTPRFLSGNGLENRAVLLPIWLKFSFPMFLLGEILWLMYLINGILPFDSFAITVLYVLGPSILLLGRSWITTFISVIWVWFPIEWGVVDDHLGGLELTLIPLDALIGLFSILWALIVHGKHIPWYDWNISLNDVKLVGKISGVLTLAIVPLGILTNFITINPDNFLDPDIKVGTNPVVNSIVYIILVFYLIFLVQGIMEETLFRDLIFKHQMTWLEDRYDSKFLGRIDMGHIMIILGSLLVISIPFWDEVSDVLANLIPVFEPIQQRLGSLALPLGEYEGKSIPQFEDISLWIFYLIVALALLMMSLFIYSRHHSPMMAALLLSSMIFGFAHFQDYRYVFFASIAGFGYGYTFYKTKNILPAAMVHMGVDAVWSLLLSY